MAVLPPGIGDPNQASQATAFLRQQPWYQAWLTRNQLTPGADGQVRLNDQQRKELRDLTIQSGIGLNHKFDEIDENGQISEGHHKGKKIAIGAAIGGLALTGLGAAGIGPLAGALAGSAGTLGGGALAADAAGVAATAGIPGAVTTAGLVGPGITTAVLGGGGGAGLGLGALTSPEAIKQIVGTGGGIASTIIQTKAQQKAADEAAAASRYAADLQDAAQKRTEQFLREQAQNQYANSEASRRGNYDQWRARENRFSTLSATLGAGARQIPDYVPGIDPRYTSGTTTPGGTPPPGAPGDPRQTSQTQVEPGGAQTSNDPTMQALLDNYKALGRAPTGPGTGPTDIAYFAKRIAETGGMTDANKSYWFGPNGRIAKELAGGVPAAGSTSTPQSTGGYQPFQYAPNPNLSVPIAPALSAPAAQLPMSGSLAQLAQQQKWFY